MEQVDWGPAREPFCADGSAYRERAHYQPNATLFATRPKLAQKSFAPQKAGDLAAGEPQVAG